MRSSTQRVKNTAIFAMLGSLMFASRVAMAGLPNIHLLGVFIASFTLVYRTRALIPLYLYVLIEGIYGSYGPIWVAYLYVWLPLWGMFMLGGKLKLSEKAKVPVFMTLCGLHGLMFGLLTAPANALLFGLKSFDAVRAWIIAGLPFDYAHAASNFIFGILILPLSRLLKKLEKNIDK